MFKKQGVLLLMGLLFLIFGFHAEPILSAEAAPVSLKPCPSSPNCVSSLAEDPAQRVDPFPLSGTPVGTLDGLARAIGAFPRSSIVYQGEGYLKAEFRTRLGFVDDLEFLVLRNTKSLGPLRIDAGVLEVPLGKQVDLGQGASSRDAKERESQWKPGIHAHFQDL